MKFLHAGAGPLAPRFPVITANSVVYAWAAELKRTGEVLEAPGRLYGSGLKALGRVTRNSPFRCPLRRVLRQLVRDHDVVKASF